MGIIEDHHPTCAYDSDHGGVRESVMTCPMNIIEHVRHDCARGLRGVRITRTERLSASILGSRRIRVSSAEWARGSWRAGGACNGSHSRFPLLISGPETVPGSVSAGGPTTRSNLARAHAGPQPGGRRDEPERVRARACVCASVSSESGRMASGLSPYGVSSFYTPRLGITGPG